MTPAVNAAKRGKVQFELHHYQHDPNHPSYGEEAALALAVEPTRVFKTLVVQLDGKGLAVGVVPVSGTLDLKALAEAAGAKRAAMAPVAEAERATGYVVGGISPLGQKRRLPLFLDATATHWPTLFVSAGRRGLEIELSAADLLHLTAGQLAPIARP